MTTNNWSELPSHFDLENDIYSLFNILGELHLLYNPSEALVFTKTKTQNILTNKCYDGGLEEFLEKLGREEVGYSSVRNETTLIHCFYELGHYVEDTSVWNELDDETILGIWMVYTSRLPLEDCDPGKLKSLKVKLAPSSPTDYEVAFSKGREHLLRGDCYQYNLTFPQSLMISDFKLDEFLSRWKNKEHRGDYAHFTSVNGTHYFSNSPECLFDLQEREGGWELHTRPIKGTISSDIPNAWETLKGSQKNESELYMITDLLRNDLNRIEDPQVEVLALKERMDVPGLVHSYSHLKVDLSDEVSLLKMIRSLFPGGSITGAPKKRVMEIISSLEPSHRGFYCGSSILKSSEFIGASINIRSGYFTPVKDKAETQMAKLLYWSGGGVTISSECDEEYREILDKTHSFVRFLS
ncbi:MAG: hypothetical protein CME60_00080 [Halobacteriovoraceae bacterium]|nr:hypothetical protein [Halobacteriovoraceae bacterium]